MSEAETNEAIAEAFKAAESIEIPRIPGDLRCKTLSKVCRCQACKRRRIIATAWYEERHGRPTVKVMKSIHHTTLHQWKNQLLAFNGLAPKVQADYLAMMDELVGMG